MSRRNVAIVDHYPPQEVKVVLEPIPEAKLLYRWEEFLEKTKSPNTYYTLIYVTEDAVKREHKFNFAGSISFVMTGYEAFNFLLSIVPSEIYIETGCNRFDEIKDLASQYMANNGVIHVVYP